MTLLSVGRPLPELRVTVRDGEAELAEDEVGEIAVAGGFLFSGCFNDPATTAERLRDGVYHTRDLGFLHEGELYVLGRKDDLLIINGRNLHAHEVEEMLGGVAPGARWRSARRTRRRARWTS